MSKFKKETIGRATAAFIACMVSIAPGVVETATAIDAEFDMATVRSLEDCFDGQPPYSICDAEGAILGGIIVGAAAMLKNLHCVFGHRKCACMENALETTHPAHTRFTDNIGSVGRSAPGSTGLGAIGYEAMNRTCP